MSFAALAWAGKCKPGSASRKLVLLALADRHNDEVDGAYPSIAWLVDFTDLNRKTVINALAELEAAGLISDSGERRGDTRQIKLYRLHIETVPEVEQSQKRNSSKKVVEQSQKRDTDTVRTSPSTKATPSPRERATRLAKDFVVPIEWIEWAISERNWTEADAKTEAASFCDHWRAKAGKDATKLDWLATWRNWVRNSRRLSGNPRLPGAPPSLVEQASAYAKRKIAA